MQFGATFPQTEIGDDPAAIREYAQAVEGLGYRSILAYDHVLGASRSTRPDWGDRYDSETAFHEPLVLFGFLAGLTSRVELVTGVIILPQRQTALVAKQAAEVDVLSGGRLRLGIGVGWNPVEFEGLGEDFSNRGARCEEQIQLLRALWAETAVTFRGRYHLIDNAGIKPLPPRRAIPIWIGGYAEEVLRRVARVGDGWTVFRAPDDAMAAALGRLRGYVREAGRAEGEVGVEAAISLAQVPEPGWEAHVEGWRRLGARTMTVNTMGCGFTEVGQHVAALRRFAEFAGVR